MTKIKSSIGKAVRNILVVGALGFSALGEINQSYAQASSEYAETRKLLDNVDNAPNKYGHVHPAGDSLENKRLDGPERRDLGNYYGFFVSKEPDIEEARRQGKILTYTKEDGTFKIIHPEHGSIEIKNLSEYVSTMANYMKKSRENLTDGVLILESELKRGYLSPKSALDARRSLNEAIKDYEFFKAMYGNLHYNNSRFRREVDFFASDVREELVEVGTKERAPYPSKTIADFSEFAKKHKLQGESREGYKNNPYSGEIGEPLTKTLEELDDVIKREVQQEFKTRRYVPWSGFGERIDEFVHPNVGDGWELASIMIPSLALFISGMAYLLNRAEKIDRKNKNEASTTKTDIKEPDPESEIINPWDINIGDLNLGGKK